MKQVGSSKSATKHWRAIDWKAKKFIFGKVNKEIDLLVKRFILDMPPKWILSESEWEQGWAEQTVRFIFSCNDMSVNISHATFKSALINWKIDGNHVVNTNGDSEIQVSEAMAYDGGLNVRGLIISDLTGIEAFTALTSLNCNENNISSLDVSNNFALLVELRCRINHLISLDVSNNTDLTYLDCSRNELSSLDVSNSTKLEKLICNYNQFECVKGIPPNCKSIGGEGAITRCE